MTRIVELQMQAKSQQRWVLLHQVGDLHFDLVAKHRRSLKKKYSCNETVATVEGLLTWLDALNSSMVWHLSRACTSLTITGGLIKLVSTFNTLRVLLFSIASASRRAVLSVRPTFVSERTSRCSF